MAPASTPTPSETALSGEVLAGRYHLLETVGSGAFGVVYRAKHLGLDQDVAVKILLSDLLRHHPEVGARFKREAKAASMLRHRNTVSVIDFGDADGVLFLAMEFIEGENLFDRAVGGEALELGCFVELGAQVLAALAAAHDQGIVHRDIKPENVMLVPMTRDDGRPGLLAKVCDFGLAKIGARESGSPSGPSLTGEGQIFGTPAYMSPEQAKGEPLGPASDLYAVGAVLYQLACGSVPFDAETAIGILMKHLTEPVEPPSARRSSVPPALERVILRALAKDPVDRFQSAREMRNALVAVLDDAETDPAWTTVSHVEPSSVSTGNYLIRATEAGTPPEFEEVESFLGIANTSGPTSRVSMGSVTGETVTAARGGTKRFLPVALAVLVVLGVIAAIVVAIGGSPEPELEASATQTDEPARAIPPTDPEPTTAPASPPPDPAAARAEAPPIGTFGAREVATATIRAAVAAMVFPRSGAPVAPGTEPEETGEGAEETASPRSPSQERRDTRRADREARRDAAEASATVETPPDETQTGTEGTSDPAGGGDDGASDAVDETDERPSLAVSDGPKGVGEDPDPVRVEPEPVESAGALSASAAVSSVKVKGSLPRTVVNRALAGNRSEFEACYAKAAKRAGGAGLVELKVTFEVDVDGLISNVRMSSADLAGLRSCVEDIVVRLRTERPDTGTVLVGFKLTYTP